MTESRFLRVVLVFVILTFLLVSGVIGYALRNAGTFKPAEYFPLDNREGKYTLTRGCPENAGIVERMEVKSDGYCVEYRGSGIFFEFKRRRKSYVSDANYKFFRITVGRSDIDLEEFVGQDIIEIKGNFNSSYNQCVMNSCENIGGLFAVLDIDGVIVAE